MIVSDAVEVFTAVPFTSVVAVIVYFPVHAPLEIGNGNDTVFEVFAGKVNGGVVNISVFALPHLFGCKGPLRENFTATVWAVVAQDTTCPVTVIFPPCCTVDGDMLSSTPQAICSASAAEELGLKFAFPLYEAIKLWVPGDRDEVVKVAAALLMVTVLSAVLPSWNVTVPLGVPAPGGTGATLAVSETDCPKFAGFGVPLSAVAVDDWLMASTTVPLTLL